MDGNEPRTILLLILAACFVTAAAARDAHAQETSGTFRPVELKLPKGYMPAPFPEKRKGQVLLAADAPAGMYIVYPNAEESPEAFVGFLKSMVAEMFLHDRNTQLSWTESALPPHKGVEGEAGTLYSASDGKKELQLAAYTRTVGGTTVAYGYYAGTDREGKGRDAKLLLDASGNGVKEFEKFCKSIKASK